MRAAPAPSVAKAGQRQGRPSSARFTRASLLWALQDTTTWDGTGTAFQRASRKRSTSLLVLLLEPPLAPTTTPPSRLRLLRAANLPAEPVRARLVPVDLAPRLGQRAPEPLERAVAQVRVRVAELALERRLGGLERRDDGLGGRRGREGRRRLERRRELDVACARRGGVSLFRRPTLVKAAPSRKGAPTQRGDKRSDAPCS